MKKVLIAACAAACVVALAGCASNAASSGAASASSETSPSSAASASAESASAEQASASADVASSEAASASAESDQGVTIEWAPVKTAAEAAQGAGFDSFDVTEEFTLGDMTFKDPTFSYADGVAQAVYEQPACGVILRKGDGVYGAPLTDRDYAEFPQKWTQNHKGLEITCYGAEEGAATVIQWNAGTAAYAVTYQGYGGEEMTLTPDEITSIVSGIQ